MGTLSNVNLKVPSLIHCIVFYVTVMQVNGALKVNNSQTKTQTCEHVVVDGRESLTCRFFPAIPIGIANAKDIKTLNMQYNNTIQVLRHSEIISAGFVRLQGMILRGCSMHRIEPGAFKRLMLTTLDLSSNLIDALDPSVFSDLINLRRLNISSNPLYRFSDNHTFPDLPNLENLDLSNCMLSNVPTHAFKKLGALKTLDLSNNRLLSLNIAMFPHVRALTSLKVGGNKFHCDCRIRIIIETFRQFGMTNIIKNSACATTGNNKTDLNGIGWMDVEKSDMICTPTVEDIIVGTFTKLAFSYTLNITSSSRSINRKLDIVDGQNVILICQYTGYPKPTIHWTMNNVVVDAMPLRTIPPTHGGRFQTLTDDELSSRGYGYKSRQQFRTSHKQGMIIQNFRASDSGSYGCLSQSTNGWQYVSSVELIAKEVSSSWLMVMGYVCIGLAALATVIITFYIIIVKCFLSSNQNDSSVSTISKFKFISYLMRDI